MSSTRHWIGWLALPLMALLVACGGGGEAGGNEEAEAPAGAGAGEEAGAPALDPSTTGTVVGRVSFEGAAPQGEPVDMSEEPTCADKHEGQFMKMPAVVGDDGGLRWVFVHVTEGLPDRSWPTPSDAVVLDQNGCEYHPHVLGIQTGQTLTIRNSDGILHNINASPSEQRGFNVSQPTTMNTDRRFNQSEVMVPVRCDVHGWMEAYIGVQDHPYFAVSAEDGTFRIENLPAGDYTIEAWHEEYGTQTQTVTVTAQQETTADFTYSGSMAGAVVPMGDPIDPHGDAHARPPVAPAGAGR